MIKAFKIGLIATLVVYVLGLSYSYYSEYKFQQQFEIYDLDKNEMLNGEEVTEITRDFLIKKAVQKSIGQTVILLIPFSIIIGFITFGLTILFGRIKAINDNGFLDYKNKRH